MTSRLVWGALIVRSFAEIIQQPLIRLRALNCAKVRGQRKMVLRISQEEKTTSTHQTFLILMPFETLLIYNRADPDPSC